MTAMLIRQQPVYLVRIEQTGWDRLPNMESPTETNTLRARLSDGRVLEYPVTVTYKPGEREKIMEAVASGKNTEAALADLVAIRNRRARLVQDMYGRIQREHKL